MGLMRQIRSTATLGILWGLGWTVTGVGLGIYRVLFGPHVSEPLRLFVRYTITAGITLGFSGFVAGIAFAGLLARAGRRKPLDELTAGSAARWGALAGVFLPASVFGIAMLGRVPILPITGMVFVALTIGAGVGALSAVGTLKLAQRATPQLAASSGHD